MTNRSKKVLPRYKTCIVPEDKIIRAVLHEERLQAGNEIEVVFRKPFTPRLISKPPPPNFSYQLELVDKAVAAKLYEAALIHRWILLEYSLKYLYWVRNGEKNWSEKGNYSSWKFIQEQATSDSNDGALIRATIYVSVKARG